MSRRRGSYPDERGRRDDLDGKFRIPQHRPGILDGPRRTYDRPFELDADVSTLDENGDPLISIHLLPRQVYDGMKLSLRTPQGRLAGTVVDIDRFYGLVAVRLDA